MRYRNDLVPE